MNETKFTPGPWEVWQGAYNIVDDLSVWPAGANGDGRKRVACWIRTAADARLIAAAPALYEALKATACRYSRVRECAGPEMCDRCAALALVDGPQATEESK